MYSNSCLKLDNCDKLISVDFLQMGDEFYEINSYFNKQIFIPWEEIKEDEQISAAIELAVNAMIQGRENPFTKLIILVEQGRCHFTKL